MSLYGKDESQPKPSLELEQNEHIWATLLLPCHSPPQFADLAKSERFCSNGSILRHFQCNPACQVDFIYCQLLGGQLIQEPGRLGASTYCNSRLLAPQQDTCQATEDPELPAAWVVASNKTHMNCISSSQQLPGSWQAWNRKSGIWSNASFLETPGL